MENRFGVKDLVLFSLVILLILVVVLAMQQYDRQWSSIQRINGKLDDIQRTISQGVNVRGGTTNPSMASGSQRYPSTDPAFYGKDDYFAHQKAARATPGFAEGDWFVDTSNGGIAKLTPFISADLYADRIQQLVCETLIGLDEDTLAWVPALATSWKLDDNVAAYQKFVDEQTKAGRKLEEIQNDPKLPIPITVTFTVRGDARFSDGQPVTVDDFLWTYNWIMNEKVAAPRDRSTFERVKSVEKLGTNQIVFKFKEPFYDVMAAAGSLYALPKHFYEKFTPEQYNQSVGLLMGSGPYRLEDPTSWKPGSGQVVLVRNEQYWGVQPAFDRIIYKEIGNDVARQTAFRNGEIDLLEARAEQYKNMQQDKELMSRSRALNKLTLNGGYGFVAWQEKRDGKPTVFADKRVRRAMAMLVDREKMMKQIMLGYAVISTGPFSPAAKQYDPSVKPLPYDVEGAKKLLAEAGLKDTDGSGVLKQPDGQPFRFKLTYPSGSAGVEKIVFAMKDAYAAAGISLEPESLEWAVFTEKLNHKDFDAVTLRWGGGNPEQDPFQMFDSSQAVSDGDNFMCYANPQADELIRKARTTIDPAKRMPLWGQVQRILYEDQPYMFLWFADEMYFMDARVENVRMTPLGLAPSARLEWYVPRDRQKWAK